MLIEDEYDYSAHNLRHHWEEALKDKFVLVILRAKPDTSALPSNWLSNFS
jgi:hypothetical protein